MQENLNDRVVDLETKMTIVQSDIIEIKKTKNIETKANQEMLEKHNNQINELHRYVESKFGELKVLQRVVMILISSVLIAVLSFIFTR